MTDPLGEVIDGSTPLTEEELGQLTPTCLGDMSVRTCCPLLHKYQ